MNKPKCLYDTKLVGNYQITFKKKIGLHNSFHKPAKNYFQQIQRDHLPQNDYNCHVATGYYFLSASIYENLPE
jgi:hypothetical protein